eukprot:gb/GFBE01074648.1/.p1 GENE.gb/GFBE01074648.1/~~gb/GFBE01074648.1/.p1  ORF type:complete len:236 (+),score=59.26 gb/GFBE01074648.1/:1-708(+)
MSSIVWNCCSTDDCSTDVISTHDVAGEADGAAKYSRCEVQQVLGRMDLNGAATAGAGVIDVVLDFSSCNELGLTFDLTDKVTIVVKEVLTGLVMAWNASRDPAEPKVKAYDRLLEVNGKSGGQAELIRAVQQAKEGATRIQLRFRQPEERSALIKKVPGKELGVILNYAKSSLGLTVKDIEDGLVKEWNAAHEAEQMSILDRVCAVNGASEHGDPEKLIALIKTSEAPVLSFMHY